MKITGPIAAIILQAHKAKDFETIDSLNLSFYGNKGRMWSYTGCLTDLDEIKGQCNPRLASNYCDAETFGCPECLKTLEQIANGTV